MFNREREKDLGKLKKDRKKSFVGAIYGQTSDDGTKPEPRAKLSTKEARTCFPCIYVAMK